MYYLEGFSQNSSAVLDFINKFLNFLYSSATFIHVFVIIFNKFLFHAKNFSRYLGFFCLFFFFFFKGHSQDIYMEVPRLGVDSEL